MPPIQMLNVTADWKRLLRLGEQLLKRVNAASQCQLLSQTLFNWTHGKVQVWLLEPFFPLPGEPGTPILPHGKSTRTIDLAIKTHHLQVSIRSKKTGSLPTGTSLAIPLVTENEVFGIIHLLLPEKKEPERELINFLEDFAGHAAVAMQIHRQEAIKNWRTEQLSLVRKITSEISNLAYADELYQRIADFIQKRFNYYNVMIYSMDEIHQKLILQASSIRNILHTDENIREPAINDGIIGFVGSTGKEYFTQDVRKEPQFRYSDYLPDTRSEATIPIKSGSKVIGVLDLQSNQLHGFNELDLFYLKPLADNIGIALKSAQLYKNLKKRADQISALLEISRALSSILDANLLAQEVTRLIHDRFEYPFVHFYVIQKRDNLILYRSGSGIRSDVYRKKHIVYKLDDPKGILPWVARNGKTYLCNNVLADELYRSIPNFASETRSELAVPVIFGEDILGILDIQSNDLNAFDDDDKNLIESIVVSIAITLRNANLYRSEIYRRKVSDSFHDVASMLTKNLDPSQLFEIILSELDKTLPSDSAAIWLLEEPGAAENINPNGLKLASSLNVSSKKLIKTQETNPDINNWLSSTLSGTDPIIRKPDDPYGPLGAAKKYSPNYSSIAVPLRVGDQILGVLALAHPKENRYGTEASTLTSTFANYASLAIQNARNLANAQSQAWISTVLLQIADSTRDANSTEELLKPTARLIPLLIGVKRVAFFLWSTNHLELTIKASYGFEQDTGSLSFSPEVSPAVKRLIRSQSSVIIQNAARDLGLPENLISSFTGTTVLIPLVIRGEVLGMLLVVHEPTGQTGAKVSFDNQTLTILQGIGSQISIAIENIRLEENRQEEAYVTAVLLQVAQAVVSQNNLADILDNIIHLMPILVGIDTCILYAWNKESSTFTPIQAFYGSHQKEAELLKCCYAPHEFRLLDWIIENRKSRVCDLSENELEPEEWKKIDCSAENIVTDQNSPIGKNLLLGYPIAIKDEIYGVLLAREMNVRPEFHLRRLDILQGIAQQIAMAFQNDLLQQEMVAREGLQREIELARQIQRTFLPDKLPLIPGWDLDFRWQTARQVGGDFYDVFQIDNSHYGLVIADVSDKGIPAALYMTVSRTLIRSQMQASKSPSQILRIVNKHLQRETPDGSFVTAVFCILDKNSGKMIYANAGHNLPIYYHANSNKMENLPSGGIALGVVDDPLLIDHDIEFSKGDFLFFYTDGLTEAFSPEGENFGEQRLQETLENNYHKNPNELLSTIEDALESFRRNEPPEDDVTLMVVQKID